MRYEVVNMRNNKKTACDTKAQAMAIIAEKKRWDAFPVEYRMMDHKEGKAYTF